MLSVTIFAVSCSTLSSLFSTVTSETNHHRRRHCNSLCRRSICINTRVAYPVETALNVAWCFSVHSLRAGYIVAIISVERILFSRCILHSVADKNVLIVFFSFLFFFPQFRSKHACIYVACENSLDSTRIAIISSKFIFYLIACVALREDYSTNIRTLCKIIRKLVINCTLY